MDRRRRPSEHDIRSGREFQALLCGALLAASFYLPACATLKSSETIQSPPAAEMRSEHLERAEKFFAQGKYEEAFKENRNALSGGGKEADIALFNLGVISAYSRNPKKDYPKALSYFKQVVQAYPKSTRAEPAMAWIHVLEEYQRVLEDKQKLAEERRTLSRERDSLAREKELLSQEREKFKQIVEKSRQVDIDIEKRRRQARDR